MPIWTVPFSTSFRPVPDPFGVMLTATLLFAELADAFPAACWNSGASAVEPSILRVPAGSLGALDLPPPGIVRALAVTWHAVRLLVVLPDDAQAPADNDRRTAPAPSNLQLIALRAMIPPQISHHARSHTPSAKKVKAFYQPLSMVHAPL